MYDGTLEFMRKFMSLRGKRVLSWSGIETALFEEGPDGAPQFEVEGVPFMQLGVLYLALEDSVVMCIGTAENGYGGCGLSASVGGRRSVLPVGSDSPSSGIDREADLRSMPKCRVSEVDLRFSDAGDISEVLFIFEDDRRILLIAGEAYPRWDGGLDFHRDDESVLLFTNPSDAATLQWK
jgi:hypothetical protein